MSRPGDGITRVSLLNFFTLFSKIVGLVAPSVKPYGMALSSQSESFFFLAGPTQ